MFWSANAPYNFANALNNMSVRSEYITVVCDFAFTIALCTNIGNTLFFISSFMQDFSYLSRFMTRRYGGKLLLWKFEIRAHKVHLKFFQELTIYCASPQFFYYNYPCTYKNCQHIWIVYFSLWNMFQVMTRLMALMMCNVSWLSVGIFSE